MRKLLSDLVALHWFLSREEKIVIEDDYEWIRQVIKSSDSSLKAQKWEALDEEFQQAT